MGALLCNMSAFHLIYKTDYLLQNQIRQEAGRYKWSYHKPQPLDMWLLDSPGKSNCTVMSLDGFYCMISQGFWIQWSLYSFFFLSEKISAEQAQQAEISR